MHGRGIDDLLSIGPEIGASGLPFVTADKGLMTAIDVHRIDLIIGVLPPDRLKDDLLHIP